MTLLGSGNYTTCSELLLGTHGGNGVTRERQGDKVEGKRLEDERKRLKRLSFGTFLGTISTLRHVAFCFVHFVVFCWVYQPNLNLLQLDSGIRQYNTIWSAAS